jgi:predicted permease
MRISRTLVATEVALSLALLVGAGLLLRSFWRLLEVNPGFRPNGVATAQLWVAVPNDPKSDPYRNPEILGGFMREVVRRVNVLPGVQEAALGSENSLPSGRARAQAAFRIEGRAFESERTPTAEFASISPEYFKVLGIPLIAGREFHDSDDTKSQPVAIIDQTLARRYWPGEDPLGKAIKLIAPPPGKDPSIVIVGVVGDVKSEGFDVAGAPHIYFSGYQFPPRGYVVYLHTATEPGALANQIRTEVQAVDSRVPIFSVRTMDQVVAESFSERRFALELLGAFAVVALLLASIGIYGVMAYTFSQRTHEIGIRVALGAQRNDILRMALGEGMALVGVGLACGLTGALFLTRFLRSMLFAVKPTDPITYAAIIALLTGAALLACYIPALRATRVDPLVALREE